MSRCKRENCAKMMEIKDSLGTQNLIDALSERDYGLNQERETTPSEVSHRKKRRKKRIYQVSEREPQRGQKKKTTKRRKKIKKDNILKKVNIFDSINIFGKTTVKKGKASPKRNRRKKKRKTSFDWILIVLGIVLLVVFICGVVAIGLFYSGQLKLKLANDTTEIHGDETEAETRAKYDIEWQKNWIGLEGEIYAYDTEAINILFLGVDTRGKMKKETDLSEDSDPGQTDAIFVMSFNPKLGTVNIIGIPRNGLVNIDKYNEDKVIYDTIYDELSLQYPWAGGGKFGIEKTKEKVSELLHGIPIHGSYAISYDSVPIVNDMVGGVDIEVLEDLTFADKKFVQGAQLHLMGKDASIYTQRRDTSIVGSASGRLKRQKQYILELFKQTKDTVKANPIIITDIYNSLSDYMLTDVDLDETVYIATQVIQCGFDSNNMFVISGTDVLNTNENILDKDGNPRVYNDLEYDKESVTDIVKQVFLTKVDIEF